MVERWALALSLQELEYLLPVDLEERLLGIVLSVIIH